MYKWKIWFHYNPMILLYHVDIKYDHVLEENIIYAFILLSHG